MSRQSRACSRVSGPTSCSPSEPSSQRSGPGSFFYLAYALNSASLREYELIVAAEELWALLGFIVLASLLVHGISAALVMNTLDEMREVPDDETGDGATADDD
ncbi:hypothetical protein EGH22_18930 [Halomicroarcula sp. F28]|uniref:hypothetical protein n=1 Tax=Haloarcula salinisoli TaxID=2487746 RepID=UPI001C736AE8|nr:hypothetical protein [Halomicroarcula salinisoli]MBX0288409.1 hypothetical protein [Halomicroarcula salinisoli]